MKSEIILSFLIRKFQSNKIKNKQKYKRLKQWTNYCRKLIKKARLFNLILDKKMNCYSCKNKFNHFNMRLFKLKVLWKNKNRRMDIYKKKILNWRIKYFIILKQQKK